MNGQMVIGKDPVVDIVGQKVTGIIAEADGYGFQVIGTDQEDKV